MLSGPENQQVLGGSSGSAGILPTSRTPAARQTEVIEPKATSEIDASGIATSGPQAEPIRTAVRQRFGMGARRCSVSLVTATNAAPTSGAKDVALCSNRVSDACAPEKAPQGITIKMAISVAIDRRSCMRATCGLHLGRSSTSKPAPHQLTASFGVDCGFDRLQ